MSFWSDLYSSLSTDAGLAALIGSRMYPDDAPADVVTPFIVYYQFATPREQSMNCAIAISKPRIQYSIYADTYAGAMSVADALRAAFAAASLLIIYEDERGSQDVTTGLHRRDLDVRISYAGA